VEIWVGKARDWLLGGNTIVRAGLAILFVGLTFLARMAAYAGLFPIEVRLALVALAGAALLAIGFNKRTQRPRLVLPCRAPALPSSTSPYSPRPAFSG
jgi:uncharacterized membrane protein